MDAINSIGNNSQLSPISLPVEEDTEKSLAYQMRQHNRVMLCINTGGQVDVGVVIKNKDHAMRELMGVYDDNYVNETTKLDLDAEFKRFNEFSAYHKLNFIDWFAFRDYQEDGYLAINEYLMNIDSNLTAEDVKLRANQLKLSLMHCIKMQSKEEQEVIEIYRGQVMSKAVVADLEEGCIFSPLGFFSAYEEQDSASAFCSDTPSDDKFNVLFTIAKMDPLAGANISDVVLHDEGNVLFLPETRFVVTNKSYDEQADMMKIELTTCEIDADKFDNDLHELVFLH